MKSKLMIIMILNKSKSCPEQVSSVQNEDQFPPCLYPHNYQAYSFIWFSTYSPIKMTLGVYLLGPADTKHQNFPLFLSPVINIFLFFQIRQTFHASFMSSMNLYLTHQTRCRLCCCLTSIVILFTSLLIDTQFLLLYN